ncbi:zona pellucida sperm-binding protein 3-like isoform X2 [Hyla sarda]|uniref:zona pellucida sperm-binding protein 3-like isoform X2 n=1 Tax=Hyla sarda TaxID=327740 RepID=UPI0024C2E811|nr:zona pellucida sperm-binding protein 3-like isoform X2 [Hyla sarda]
MELWIRWRCLLVVLLYGSGFSSALGRHRRQSNTWRSNQPEWGSPRRLGQSASGLGSSRSNPWAQSVSGFGSARALMPVYGWGSRSLGADHQSRQLPPQSSSSPISVQCNEDSMVVTVKRDFYGNGFLVKASDFRLGSCSPETQSSDTVMVFDNEVQACGSRLQMTPDFMIYQTMLNYNPVLSNSVIIRSSPAMVPVLCYYPRHGNVSSKAIRPTWAPFSTTVSTEERLAFSMYLMTDDWSARRSSSIFQLGDVMNIEASVVAENHVPMILFVDSCVATTTSRPNSSPRYEIIADNGCLVDGTQEDSSSAFRSPRIQPNKIQFMVDAFRFIATDASTIYITCTLKTMELRQPPDQMNKACSYVKTSRSWSPVEGSNDICRCCDSANCAVPLGQTRRWGPVYGGSRHIGKREAFIQRSMP